MGIPFYFVSLIKAHKTIVSRVRTRLEPNVLAIDFNCLIHTYMDDARPIESILEALATLLVDTTVLGLTCILRWMALFPMQKSFNSDTVVFGFLKGTLSLIVTRSRLGLRI